jgi:hypothetical protein
MLTAAVPALAVAASVPISMSRALCGACCRPSSRDDWERMTLHGAAVRAVHVCTGTAPGNSNMTWSVS